MNTSYDLEERVNRGATFLDVKRPNWYNEIDLNCFNMNDYGYCILGQLFVDDMTKKNGKPLYINYSELLKDFKISGDYNGFNDTFFGRYKELEKLWSKQILKRREQECTRQ